jgi:hypothetical protein
MRVYTVVRELPPGRLAVLRRRINRRESVFTTRGRATESRLRAQR